MPDSDDRHFRAALYPVRPGASRDNRATGPFAFALNLRRRLDPRRHLAAAIGWAVFGVVMLFALAAAAFTASMAEGRVRHDSQRQLAQVATGVARALTVNLENRHQLVRATAEQIAQGADRGRPALRAQLEAVRRQFPEFEWLGVANAQGRIVAATGEPDAGQDVSGRRWFQGAIATSDGGFETSGLILPTPTPTPTLANWRADESAETADSSSIGGIEIAAPIAAGANGAQRVLGATLSWAWIDRLKTELLSALDVRGELQLMLASEGGSILIGPPSWIGTRLSAAADLSGGGLYLVGRGAALLAPDGGPPWTVVVRQDAATALAPARAIGHAVFLSVLGAGVLSAAIAVALVRMLIRRLARLAEQAQALQATGSGSLAIPAGNDEVSRIGAILADVVDRLQHEKQALMQLNAELDQRVANRTARIERMADDARHAAVTRERLRLARDLHDTLAHSMMALLTQIRLVRKLRARFSDEQLKDELERAEAVAASGLTEARAAINQMRHNGVRETGLGPALSELLARFRERTGLTAGLRVEASAGGLADERAETVFRIVEEALRNVERHARAREVTVSLLSIVVPGSEGAGTAHVQRVGVEVADDGVGFDPARRPRGHYGLRGMQEQATLIGARLELTSQPDHGTRVAFEFEV